VKKVTNVMTRTTQREKIFRFIASRKQATAQEVANWFKLPVSSVRFHLRILVSEGRINAARTTRIRQLGKPRHVYHVVGGSDADVFRSLLDAVISSDNLVADRSVEVIELLARTVIGEHERRGGSLTLDLIDLIERLNESGYDARWEVHRNAPSVILQECPYARSVCRKEIYCEMDRKIISSWTRQTVKAVKTRASSDPDENCVFELS